jgi:hypothetical protein
MPALRAIGFPAAGGLVPTAGGPAPAPAGLAFAAAGRPAAAIVSVSPAAEPDDQAADRQSQPAAKPPSQPAGPAGAAAPAKPAAPAGAAAVKPGPQWVKYVAADKTVSFYHPAGWKAQVKGATIQTMAEDSAEEVILISLPNPGRKTPAALADEILAMFRKEIPDLKTADLAVRDGRVASMTMTYSRQKVAFRGQISVITEADKGMWLSYSAPAAHYSVSRASAIGRGVAGSLRSGPDAVPPTVLIPPPDTPPPPPAAAAGKPEIPRANSAKPNIQLPPPDAAKAHGAGAPPEIKDAWFLPAGRELRGYYAAALLREEVAAGQRGPATSARSSGYSQVSAASSGGDFQAAFYGDGTVRAKYLVVSAGAGGTTNVPFRYEGRYTLGADGRLSAGPLTLANTPRTSQEFEKHMTQLRFTGRHDAAADRFTVTVETYDPSKKRWEKLAENRILARATARKSSFSGTSRGVSGQTTVTKD